MTNYTINGITAGTYYVAVTAYDTTYNPANDDPNTIVNENQTNGNESWFEEKVGTVIPVLPRDCNGDGQTTIDEVQKAINQFLEVSPAQPCNDLNGNGQVTIDEVQQVINAFLGVS